MKYLLLIIAIAITALTLGSVLYILNKRKHEGFVDVEAMDEKKCARLAEESAISNTKDGNVPFPEECLGFASESAILNTNDGSIPFAKESSSIPGDVSGATTANPQVSLAAPKDIQALSDSLQTFKLLVAQKDPTTTDLSNDMIKAIQGYQASIPVLENQFKTAYSNPNLTGMTTEKSSELLQQIASFTQVLRSAQVIRGGAQDNNNTRGNIQRTQPGDTNVAYIATMPQPTLVATPVGQITLQDIINLRERINKESLKLANLRTTAPTMRARQNQLEELAGDLTNIITEVQRGTKAIEDVPITKDDADNFMRALETNEKTLPALQLPMGQTKTTVTNMPMQSSQLQVPAVQQLLDKAQYLKWDLQVNLSYDPADARQDNVLKRLEQIERNLTNFAISETPLPDSVVDAMKMEMKVLQQMVTKKGEQEQKKQKRGRPTTDYSAVRANNTFNVSSPEFPGADRLTNAQDTGFPDGMISPDVYVRPGFAMNDDTIARRASASAFDPSTVGGPDWKKRSLELCRQVGAANLGAPSNFGCIENPSEVGSNYSWKGNYTMVCNRLGDTWGGWYPDMFGCPKYDPQQKFKGTML